jgi:hypothetical protein
VNTAVAFNEEEPGGEPLALAPDVIEVRRNGGLAAVVGGAASGVAIAYLRRATHTGDPLDWLLFALMAVVGAAYLRSFVDARTPLLVADTQGVRIRLGRTWRGLPWGALASVQHAPRRGLVRDGRLVFEPRNEERALADLDGGGRRASGVNRRLFGAPLALPLGISTRVTGASGDLTAALEALSAGGVPVVEVMPPAKPEPAEETGPDDVDGWDVDVDPEPAARRLRLRDPRPVVAAAIDGLAARMPRLRPAAGGADDDTATLPALPAMVASATPAPLREPRTGNRVEVTRDIVRGGATLDPAYDDAATRRELPEGRELRRAGSVNLVEDTLVWGDRVRPIARARDSVEPLVIDDFPVEPAPDPVVGPELAAARTRIGLSIDQLADRTRIRPHVIESIEVDDFAPCGGDFYARGHLRTLARVLGLDAAPLLATYDERYADAPVSPRRVFEAELASGTNGGIRSTRGGPNWNLLIGVVMALILLWSIARLAMDDGTQISPAPVLNRSGGIHPASQLVRPVHPIKVVFTATTGPVHLVVRDGDGKVQFSGDLAAGDVRRVRLVPPVKVSASDGGAITAVIDGQDQGTLGTRGKPSRGTFTAR